MAAMVAVLAVYSAVAVVVAIGAGTRPAAAHVCVRPVEVDVGAPSAITVGVPAEQQAVVEVSIDIPAGFELDEARDAAGWTAEVDGSTVRYTGGEIAALQCGYFTVTGTATRRAKLVFAVTTTDTTGSTTGYGRGRLGSQEVYAGIEAFPDEGGGVDPTMIAGIVLVTAGVGAAVVLALRRRRG